ncbi:MAG: metallopeptidase, partial [Oscillospiraceae bacterium]|nr:metallopeptidase [Oscillospiraceae bacterium]
QESFVSKINLHIIQCDAEIQEDFKITSQEEFDDYIRNMCLKGFGGTDFRPVFDHVNDLIRKKEFQNLKGMLYFTDGCGTYPKHEPDYQTAFVFLDDHYHSPAVPSWAIRVILRSEDILE